MHPTGTSPELSTPRTRATSPGWPRPRLTPARRRLLNRAFLVMAVHAGLDAIMRDPLDAMTVSLLKAADVLAEQDPQCRRYIGAYRKATLAT